MTRSAGIPKVAIVITVYNGEMYIGACVKAALGQTYPAFEVVVVDDGSTDGTGHVCQSIQDVRLRYVKKERIGRQRALNAGIALTDADFIAINDADDLSLPHRLQYTIDFLLAHPETAFVGTGFSKTTEFVQSIPTSVLEESLAGSIGPAVWPSRSAVYRRNVFNHSTLMYPKRTWERIDGYDESLTLSEDYDFYLRAMQCGPVALLPGRTVHWYTNPRGVFKQRSHQENLEVLRFIKRRAHGLLGLPAWLRLYQRIWEVGFHCTSSYPALLDVAKGLRSYCCRTPFETRPFR
jgi:glycosyltransferase involved in cell wall biosynthesis